jgi:hypothetical protein
MPINEQDVFKGNIFENAIKQADAYLKKINNIIKNLKMLSQISVEGIEGLKPAVIKDYETLNKKLKETIVTQELITEAKKEAKQVENALIEVKKKAIKTDDQLYKIEKDIHAQQEVTNKTAKQRIIISQEEIKATEKINYLKTRQAQIDAENSLIASELIKKNKEQAKANLGMIDAYKKLEDARNKAQRKLKNEIAQYGELDDRVKKTRIEFEKLDKSYRNINKIAKDGHMDVGRYGLAIGGVAKNLIGAFGLIGGVQLFASVMRSSFKIMKDFEKGMDVLASITGGTKEEMKALKEQIQNFGGVMGKMELIEASTDMARIGYTANQVRQSLNGVVLGASAMGAEVSDVAELSAKAINIFGLKVTDTERVVSTLAVSANKTGTSFDYFKTSLPYASVGARNLGYSIEQLSAFLGILADNGIQASKAGTGLRDIFTDLSVKGMSLDEALDMIAKSTNKDKTAFELFGKTSKDVAIILSNNRGKFDQLTKSISNQEEALKNLADVKTDNLAGDIDRMTVAWDEFILSVENGDGVIATFFRGITNDITKLIGILKGIDSDIDIELKNNKLVKLVKFTAGDFNAFSRNDLSDSTLRDQLERGYTNKGAKDERTVKSVLDNKIGTRTELLKKFQTQLDNTTESQYKYLKAQSLKTISSRFDKALLAEGEEMKDIVELKRVYLADLEKEINALEKTEALVLKGVETEASRISMEELSFENKEKERLKRAKALAEEEELRARATGLIGIQRNLISDLSDDLEKAKDETIITKLNTDLEKANAELERLLGLGKKIEEEEIKLINTDEIQNILDEQDRLLSQGFAKDYETKAGFDGTITAEEYKDYEKNLTLIHKQELERQLNDTELKGVERLELQREYNNLIIQMNKDASDKIQEQKAKEDKAREDKLKAEQEAIEILSTMDEAYANKKLANIDKQIQASQKEQDRLKEIASKNSTDQSKGIIEAEKKQIELEKKKEKIIKARLRRENLLMFNGYVMKALADEADKTPLLTAIKEMAKTQVASNLVVGGKYKNGSDFIGNGKGSEVKVHNGTDGHLGWLDYGEMVFDNKESNELRGLGFGTRKSVIEALKLKTSSLKIIPVGQSQSELIDINKQVVSILQNLPNNMPSQNINYNPFFHHLVEENKRGNSRSVRLQKIGKLA